MAVAVVQRLEAAAACSLHPRQDHEEQALAFVPHYPPHSNHRPLPPRLQRNFRPHPSLPPSHQDSLPALLQLLLPPRYNNRDSSRLDEHRQAKEKDHNISSPPPSRWCIERSS